MASSKVEDAIVSVALAGPLLAAAGFIMRDNLTTEIGFLALFLAIGVGALSVVASGIAGVWAKWTQRSDR